MNSLAISFYLLGGLMSWFILYFVVKAAVRNGIREARADKEVRASMVNSTLERPASSAQMKLHQQYDKGEISFDEFKSQWNKLSI